MPKKRCKSCLDFGKGMFFIALSFSGSGEIPITDILCPKNISLIAPKTHWSLFNIKPDFRVLFRKWSVQKSNWFWEDAHMMTSS